jgi:hypothetical protein
MPDHVRAGESIEGKKIRGTSRVPIEYKGIYFFKEKAYHKFSVKFDINAEILKILSKDDTKIITDAYVNPDDKVVCNSVVILSLKNKYSGMKVNNASSTHSAFGWTYPKQTNVQIITSHDEIKNALERRARLQNTMIPFLQIE